MFVNKGVEAILTPESEQNNTCIVTPLRIIRNSTRVVKNPMSLPDSLTMLLNSKADTAEEGGLTKAEVLSQRIIESFVANLKSGNLRDLYNLKKLLRPLDSPDILISLAEAKLASSGASFHDNRYSSLDDFINPHILTTSFIELLTGLLVKDDGEEVPVHAYIASLIYETLMKKISDGNLSDIPTIMDVIQPLDTSTLAEKLAAARRKIEDTYSAYAIKGEYGD